MLSTFDDFNMKYLAFDNLASIIVSLNLLGLLSTIV